VKIPFAVNLVMNKIAGASYSELDRGIHNGMIHLEDDRLIVTQRPSLDWIEDASDTGVDNQGRGVYYWPLSGHRYIVNYDTLYKDNYSTIISAGLTAGTRRCYFYELDTLLILIDWENDQAWTITTGDVVTEITDTDFPPKATPAVSLAHGGAVMDGFFFVLGADDGTIYNSAYEDATSFPATGLITAERDPDGGQYLGKHHDNLVALGPSSIEFFYNNANPTGSPLNRRPDVAYTSGCADGGSVWEEGDRIFFIGADENGGLGVFLLQAFQIRRISGNCPSLESLITTAINSDSYVFSGSGFSANGHTFYILTFYVETTVLTPESTFVYDATTDKWYTWESTYLSNTAFPIMQWTRRKSTTARRGEGILSNGDIVTVIDDMNPQDTIGGTGGYVADGFVVDGFVTAAGQGGTGFEMRVRVGASDLGSRKKKTFDELVILGDKTENSETATVKWSNEDSRNFNSGRTLDLSKDRRLTAMGSAFRRNFEVSVTSTDRVYLEAMDVAIGVED